MGGRNKAKARQKVPISPGLAEVPDELDSERKKLTSLHGASLVFTRDGKPISKNALRKAFESAKKQIGAQRLPRFTPLRGYPLDVGRDPR